MPAPPDSGTSQLRLSLEPERKVYRVAELNREVQRLFESDFGNLSVAGEISGCRMAASGHFYFVLKDEQSQVKCVFFKGTARYARAKPKDGLAVIARGRLEVYEARGEYQLIVEALEPQGAGALQLRFEELKKRLAAEGLFDAGRKRALPRLPRRIGLVTSPSGAVIRDMLHVFERRFRGLHLRLYPAQVQGENAVEQVCAGLRFFSDGGWAELVIVARGGGSLEDLWTFNEEAVARAIAASRVPVISAIGHETDFTIADFVADQRAPTPSAAAEIAVCTSESLLEQIAGCRSQLVQAMRYRLVVAENQLRRRGTERAAALIHRRLTAGAQRLDELDDRVRRAQQEALQSGTRRLAGLTQRLEANDLRLRLTRIRHRSEHLEQRARAAMETKLGRARVRCDSFTLHLNQLSPLAILSRGYAIVATAQGHVVRAAGEVERGDTLTIRLHQGHIDVQVAELHPVEE